MSELRPVLAVLDDDQQIVDVVAEVAQDAGFTSRTYTAAEPFLGSLNDCCPDVIVLDLQMPEIDGVQVLRVLADRSVDAGIILLTGLDERTMMSAEGYGVARGLNVLAAIQKPFVPDELTHYLKSAGISRQPLSVGDLRHAIESDQLIVHYQPTLRRFADGSWDIAAVEALLRWNHPIKGMLQPSEFIAMGEDNGLGGAMTDLVIQRGVEQLKGWQALRIDLALRVNISATLIGDLEFPDRLAATLAEYEIEPSRVTLEITETAMLDQSPDMFDIMTRLRVKNVNLAIDDFGIGYSSLTQLFAMPFNEMKIDKSLTMRVPQSKEARIMIGALVELAHKLNLTACAEGVETEEALEFLAETGCDSAQGFFISRPIEAHAVKAVVERWDRRQHVPYAGEIGEATRNAAS